MRFYGFSGFRIHNFLKAKAIMLQWLASVMLKDLAIEISDSVGLVFLSIWFFALMMAGTPVDLSAELMMFFSFVGFILLLFVSVRQFKSLLNRGKTKHAFFFIAVIVAVVVISFIMVWNFLQNMRV